MVPRPRRPGDTAAPVRLSGRPREGEPASCRDLPRGSTLRPRAAAQGGRGRGGVTGLMTPFCQCLWSITSPGASLGGALPGLASAAPPGDG